jgi:hypothetical protein
VVAHLASLASRTCAIAAQILLSGTLARLLLPHSLRAADPEVLGAELLPSRLQSLKQFLLAHALQARCLIFFGSRSSGQGKPLKLSGFNLTLPFRFNHFDFSSRSDPSGRAPENDMENLFPEIPAESAGLLALGVALGENVAFSAWCPDEPRPRRALNDRSSIQPYAGSGYKLGVTK